MKVSIAILTILALTSATPKFSKLSFRNFYKTPVNTVDSKARIIGGQEATPHSLPYQALLVRYTGTTGLYCAGSLISQNYVVSSAYCINGASYIVVLLGVHNSSAIESTQVTFLSTDFKIHEEFDNASFNNDIGVIKLSQSVEFNHAIQPIDLPHDVNNNYLGALTTASGWGVTTVGSETITPLLNFVQLTVISNEVCGQIYGTLPESVLCTSATGAGVCAGDIGGPLVTDGFLIGIVSLTSQSCVGFELFTRVTSYLNWIRANTDVE